MQTKTQKEAKALKKGFKSQSAMEYLMTYGWAILIIAVVLSVLFYLGVFSGSSFLPQGCIAQSGFLCKAPILTTGGVLQLQIGEETVQTMNNTNVYFVPQGGTMSNASSASIGKLNSAQITNVSIQLSTGSLYPSSYKLGTNLAGTIYLSYTYQGMVLTSKIGTLTVKSVNPTGVVFGSPPSSIPSGISVYVPIIITNGQTSNTPAPFQQMVQFSEANYANYMTYNGNSANFEFFTSTGSIIPAWIESNSSGTITAWLNLQNGISASKSIEVYLGFASQSTNLLSNTGTAGIGEAPQLSSTYSQYDDGASVFNLYTGFAGTSIQAPWSAGGGTVNNGFMVSNAAAYVAAPAESITYNSAIGSMYVSSLPSYAGSPFFCWLSGSSCAVTQTNIRSVGVYTVLYPGGGSTGSAYFIIDTGGGGGSWGVKWAFIAAYPPNGVMPSVSFGGVS